MSDATNQQATVRFMLDGEVSAEVTVRFGDQLTEGFRAVLASSVRAAAIAALGYREVGDGSLPSAVSEGLLAEQRHQLDDPALEAAFARLAPGAVEGRWTA